jgi:hypothetical protein
MVDRKSKPPVRAGNDTLQALRDELAEMARTGSPETAREAARDAEVLRRSTALAGTGRSTKNECQNGDRLELAVAERRFQNVSQSSVIWVAGLLCLGGIPICLSATPISIGILFVAVAIIGYCLILNKDEHRDAYIALQVVKGTSERDALRDYENRYSGS